MSLDFVVALHRLSIRRQRSASAAALSGIVLRSRSRCWPGLLIYDAALLGRLRGWGAGCAVVLVAVVLRVRMLAHVDVCDAAALSILRDDLILYLWVLGNDIPGV
jgi:hypothetical protein